MEVSDFMSSFIHIQGEHAGSIDLNVRRSSQHIEVNLSESRGYEQHVIMTLINEFHIPSEQAVQCDQTNCKGMWLVYRRREWSFRWVVPLILSLLF